MISPFVAAVGPAKYAAVRPLLDLLRGVLRFVDGDFRSRANFVDCCLDRLLDLSGSLINLAFHSKLVISGQHAGGLFDSAFYFIHFSTHDDVSLFLKRGVQAAVQQQVNPTESWIKFRIADQIRFVSNSTTRITASNPSPLLG
jgi:hypothetical protein